MHNTSEVLNTAADLIEKRGWIGSSDEAIDPWGGGAEGSGPVCLEGGMLAALGLGMDAYGNPARGFRQCPAYVAVREHVGSHPGDPLWVWNDRPARTASEVIEVLRAAALIEAAREEQDAAWSTYACCVTA